MLLRRHREQREAEAAEAADATAPPDNNDQADTDAPQADKPAGRSRSRAKKEG